MRDMEDFKRGEKQYKKGDVLVMSTGEYSDYGISLICKVLKDFNEREVADLYTGKKDEYEFDEINFLKMLTNLGYIEEIPYKEWIFSSYSKLEFS